MSKSAAAVALGIVAAAAAAALGCLEARAVGIEKAARGSKIECPIRVTFGSYATGIDRQTLDAVKRHIEADRDIARAVMAPFGLEGEVDLCVFPKPGAEPGVEAALRALLPPPGGSKRTGWVKLTVGKPAK